MKRARPSYAPNPVGDSCEPRRRSYNRGNSRYSPKRITYVTRTVEKAAIQFNGQIWTSRTFTFRLSDLVNYTELTNLFDLYKLEKVKLHFLPRYNNTNAPFVSNGDASNATNTMLWNINSEDGTQRLFSESDAFQSMNAKMRVSNKPFSIWCKPKFQVEASTALAIAAAKPTTGFLDCDNFGVVHYGHEIAGYNMGAAAGQLSEWKCYATYYLALKDVK